MTFMIVFLLESLAFAFLGIQAKKANRNHIAIFGMAFILAVWSFIILLDVLG